MAKIEGYHLQQTGDEVQEILNTPVKTIQQTLTEEQKAQARKNIGATSSAVSITYSNLVALRRSGNFVPGQYYRITDYVTTTADAESRSVGHLFDVIVLALDESHLSEEAFATHHDGDTYFANSALDAWRIWYCLDNDTTRFAWADTTNGKGVIYRMIDEWNNDIPYDFKNIQFKRYKVTPNSSFATEVADLDGLYIGIRQSYDWINYDANDSHWYYTFSILNDDLVTPTDASVVASQSRASDNVWKKTSYSYASTLNNIVCMGGTAVYNYIHNLNANTHVGSSFECINNTFGENPLMLTFFGNISNNTATSQFRHNIIVGDFRHMRMETDTQRNIIEATNQCSFCQLGQDFSDNLIVAPTIALNTHENAFRNNVIVVGTQFRDNRFGQEFSGNEIYAETYMYGNEFGPIFQTNTVSANQILNNIIGGSVISNSFHVGNSGDINNNHIGSFFKFNTIYGKFVSNRTSGQITLCTFNATVGGCTFDAILQYVNIPQDNNTPIFGYNDVRGAIRGTESAPIVLSSPNFRVSAFTGVKRRVSIEGDSDGSIIATWKGTDGVPTGIRSTDNGTTWAAYSPAPIDVVKYTQQTLTNAQKQQARTNIGAGTGKELRLLSSVFDVPLPTSTPKTAAEMAAYLGISTQQLLDLQMGRFAYISFGEMFSYPILYSENGGDIVFGDNSVNYILSANANDLYTLTKVVEQYIANVDITTTTDQSGNTRFSAAIVSGTFAELESAILANKDILVIGRFVDQLAEYQYFRVGNYMPNQIVFSSVGTDFLNLTLCLTWLPASGGNPESLILNEATGILGIITTGDGNAVTGIEQGTGLNKYFPIASKDKTFVDTAQQSLTDAQKLQARSNIEAGIPIAIEYGGMTRNNVSGTGNITIANTRGTFPTLVEAGEYEVVVEMQSDTANYSLNVTFGSNTYTLTSNNGAISDKRTLTIATNSTWSASLTGAVAPGTIINVSVRRGILETAAPVAKSGSYNDLSNKPTIPTVESMTSQEVATAVASAWTNVMGS